MGHLRRTAAVLLLGLPLLLGFASGAQAQATLSISGPASADEGDSGTRDLTYTVSLSSTISSTAAFKVCFTGTATAGVKQDGSIADNADYQVRAGNIPVDISFDSCTSNLGITAGNTSYTFEIRVKGDTDPESDETVVATLSMVGSNPGGVTIGTATATHTIQDDDTPTLSISTPADANEGNSGTRDLSFPVNLTAPASKLLTYNVCFSGSAMQNTSGSFSNNMDDYQAFRGGGQTDSIRVAPTDLF